MPYVNNSGIKIRYQVEGDGTPLVLQHGGLSCLENWYDDGYVEALQRDYRLVLIDARGHGGSDKPHDPAAYERTMRVSDVIAVLDYLDIEKGHFFGYSMGGFIGFELAKHAPNQFYSMIIGGMHPYKEDIAGYDQFIALLEKGMGAYVADREAKIGPIPAIRRDRLLANDNKAIIALLTHFRNSPGIEEVLPAMMMPCLLFAGDADGYYSGAKECVQHMPNASFVSLAGLNHAQAITRNDLVLPHVTKFLREASQSMIAT